MCLLRVNSSPPFSHLRVAFGLLTLQEKLTVFFSCVSMSSRGTTILRLSSVEKNHQRRSETNSLPIVSHLLMSLTPSPLTERLQELLACSPL